MSKIPRETENEDALLFSESAGRFLVTVKSSDEKKFEKMMKGIPCEKIGRVRGDKRVVIRRAEHIVINENLEGLENAWKGYLKD